MGLDTLSGFAATSFLAIRSAKYLGLVVAAWTELTNKAEKKLDLGRSLAKNPLFIGEMLETMWDGEEKSSEFARLIENLTRFAFM